VNIREHNIITDFVFALSFRLSVLQRVSNMSKTGQARVLRPEQFAHLLNVKEHRYPEKNTALVQISFKLGLRVH